MKTFDLEEFRKRLENRLAEVEAERAREDTMVRERIELDGYIRCLKNILFMLPPKA